MADPDEFNLHELIRQVCAETADLNLHKIANEVDARIRPENREAALRQALPRIVYEVARGPRRGTRVQDDGDGATELDRKRSARSSKVAGIREYWRKALLELHSVNGVGDLKRLADLTRDDLLFNIKAREEVARRNAAKALEFRSLLDLVTRHDVERVGDLPEDVLAVTLVRSA
jgi:hypothetical protein